VYTQYIDMHSDLVISQSDGRPMYLQIVEQIKQRVAVGDWASGQEIPSIRQLAVALRVSVITVKRAYLELEREGVIVTQQGKGSMVAASPELTPQLYERELAGHVERAAQLGELLGLSPEELASRVSDTAARLMGDRTTKETA
jgi:GntR family transcriptional regulator